MKGIILAGGEGTRLYPLTLTISKQLLPIYDKPMIYYPLSTLMLAGIRDILIITTERDLLSCQRLLGDGGMFGVSIQYKIQSLPRGLAEAFLIGEEFIGSDSCAMILGDNLFYGNGLSSILKAAIRKQGKATVFGYYVDDPQRFGVVTFNEKGQVFSIQEKPENPTSNYAVTGLYFYDNRVVNFAKKLKPSSRGELEITDLNRMYLEEGDLEVVTLGRGFAWMDAGTVDSLMDAALFVQTLEKKQGIQIAAPEEIAYHKCWISKEQLIDAATTYKNVFYGKHLMSVADGKIRY